ncbi:MAG: hypothetical protein IT440_04220 [Phycisphaeraceae bacterium]|nr:hypothetical protein [Phycisphaeraceae bacterium]
MNTHERLRAVLNFQPFDRLPVVEWASWWDKTLERWHQEGLPESARTQREINDHFGNDIWIQDGAWLYASPPPAPASHGSGIIADEDDYLRMILPLHTVDGVKRQHWEDIGLQQQRGDVAIWITFPGFFWHPRTLLGVERHLYAFYDQPKLIHRINTDLLEWQLRALDAMTAIATPVFATFAEDMSYNHGPMISKDIFDEFLAPYYRPILAAMKKKGVLAIIDSDGDMSEAIRWYREVGADGMLPLERQAGSDVAALRAEHPDMRMIGNFDKMTMSRGEDAMRAEFERLLPTAAMGGYVISCDHQTPPGVSYQSYQCYLRLFREYAQRAGAMSRQAVQ